jgi:hypothetical protein
MTLAKKLEAIVAWLDACPPGGYQDRELSIEVGVERGVRVSVRLDAGWIAKRKGQRWSDGPLGSRTYTAEGRTVAAALRRLRVPTPKPRKRGR